MGGCKLSIKSPPEASLQGRVVIHLMDYWFQIKTVRQSSRGVNGGWDEFRNANTAHE
jgi:hypothetical protein